MATAVAGFVSGIGKDEKWKIDIMRHDYHKHDMSELIKELTEPVDRKCVDLKNPEKIIRVEIIRSKAGVSLLKPEEILSVSKK